MNRKIKVGISDEFLKAMSLHDLFNMFQGEFDETVTFCMSEKLYSTSYTFFTFESPNFKDNQITPLYYVKQKYEESDEGPEYYFEIEDYSDSLEQSMIFDIEADYPYVHITSKQGFKSYFNTKVVEEALKNYQVPTVINYPGLDEIQKESEKKEAAYQEHVKRTSNINYLPKSFEDTIPIFTKHPFQYIDFTKEVVAGYEKLIQQMKHPFQLAAMQQDPALTDEEAASFFGIEVKSCVHSWKFYEGFTDRYFFCEHCQEKRDE